MTSCESSARRTRLLVSAAVAAAAVLPAAAEAQRDPSAAPPSAAVADVRRPAELVWRVRTLDGRSVRLEELGSGPLVLNFWATWCRPCVAELRSLQALHDSLAAEGVAFALVSPEPLGVVRRFVGRRGIAMPVFVEDQPLPAAFGMRAIPTTWVIDRGGNVAAVRRGAADWDTPAVRALLRALLREDGGLEGTR